MIDALLLGIRKFLFIPLRMSLNNAKTINITGDMKSLMFVYSITKDYLLVMIG